ncbi:hypothetical protein PV726_37790 [Streptomyces europaeiscabiei]|uniref:hypothetical protein n=1 Tax=Streptomyces europaeiscabiei TaxID=146819 RepID=UPI0029BBDA64|nr:hypothetical protein [Streptomyces europaeiscabiei]MDX3695972.1 hypothetical protein [Streptomyces europaeiscabiei]
MLPTKKRSAGRMDVDVKGMLVASLEELRIKEGMTSEKLRRPEQALLRQMLGASTPEEAHQRLSELVLAMPDNTTTRAVRNALVIGDDIKARNGLDDRRRWASELTRTKGETLFPGSRPTAVRHENRGFQEIAQLLLDRQHQLGVPVEEAPWNMEENQSFLDHIDWDALAAHDRRQRRLHLWVAAAASTSVVVCSLGLVLKKSDGFVGSFFLLTVVIEFLMIGLAIGKYRERKGRRIILAGRQP